VFSASQVCHHWRGVLTSSPSLWTRFSCRRVSWTIASLERCKSIPIQMEVYGRSLSVALEKVSLRGAKIASLTISLRSDRIPQLLQLLTSSASSVEQLHILCEDWEFGEQTAHEFWQGLASLRQLFASEYFIPLDQLRAPNLVHLTLDEPRLRQRVALQSILNALRGCPRLETLFISDSCSDYGDLIDDHSLVSLPRLRTIELGPYEVQSYLVTHLQLPPNIAAGFRMLPITKIHGAIPLTVVTAMRHVLGRIDIRCITLAVPPCPQETPDLFIRFEGLQTSLEITSQADTYEELREVFFGPRGVLFSHSPRINNVRELRIIGCPFADGQVLDHINVAMPNIVSISFFHCEEPHVFVLPPPNRPFITSISTPRTHHGSRIRIVVGKDGESEKRLRRTDQNSRSRKGIRRVRV